MNVPISEAKARLTDLVRRAEAGKRSFSLVTGVRSCGWRRFWDGRRGNSSGTRPLRDCGFSGTRRDMDATAPRPTLFGDADRTQPRLSRSVRSLGSSSAQILPSVFVGCSLSGVDSLKAPRTR
jgi:hypothetical protein